MIIAIIIAYIHVPLVTLLLLFHLKRLYDLWCDDSTRNLAIYSVISIGLGIVTFYFLSMDYISIVFRIIAVICGYMCLFTTYLAHDSVYYGNKNKQDNLMILRIMILFTIFVIILDLIKGDGASFSRTHPNRYDTSYFLYWIILELGVVYISFKQLSILLRKIVQNIEIEYRIRISFFVASATSIIISGGSICIDAIFHMFGYYLQHTTILLIFNLFNGLTLVFCLLGLSSGYPARYLSYIITLWKDRHLYWLRRILIRIVPSVQLPGGELGIERLFVEIGHARRIISTNIESFTADIESEALIYLNLFREGIKFTSGGNYPPALLPQNVDAKTYYISLAHELKRRKVQSINDPTRGTRKEAS